MSEAPSSSANPANAVKATGAAESSADAAATRAPPTPGADWLDLGEVRADEYCEAFGENFVERCARDLERLEPMVADGLVIREPDGSLRVTHLGRLLVRNVASAFDAYLEEQQSLKRPLFSKTL